MKPKTLLIDGDILLYQIACRNESTIVWPNGAESVCLTFTKAKKDVQDTIDDLLQKSGCVDFVLCFTHIINFRYRLLPSYKHNRADKPKPKLLELLRNYLQSTYKCMSQKYLEADDLMGIMGTKAPDKFVLATIDKDFKCLPANVLFWNKEETPRLISEEEADYNFHYQWLVGDSTDGYSGCYRIGDKKARAILDSVGPEDWTACVIATYADNKKYTYTWNDIVTQARMARILRYSDWDTKNNYPILWEPEI